MTTLKSDCKKFAPNMFSKTKCQHCFKIKDAHSVEALENSRAARNVSKCGYLFVAPDFDFSVPLNRTKRWQRRWFVLYDDGELTYSVDEHPDTIPQAVIDMNNVLEVIDAESVTESPFSLAITTTEKTYFIKGTSREEVNWWCDVLSRFTRNTVRGKNRRFATIPGSKPIATSPTSQNPQPVDRHNQVPSNALIRPRFNSFTSKTTSSTTTYNQPVLAITECTKNTAHSQAPNQYQLSHPHTKNNVLLQTVSSEQILSTQVPPADHLIQISHVNCSLPSERWIVPTKFSQSSHTNLVQCHTLASSENTQSAKQNVSAQSSSSQPVLHSPFPLKMCNLRHYQNINSTHVDGSMSAKNLDSLESGRNLELKRDLLSLSLLGELDTCKSLSNKVQEERLDWDIRAKERNQAETENNQQYLKQDKRGRKNLRRTRSDGVAEIIKAGSRLQSNRAVVSSEKNKYGRNDGKEENNCHSNPLYLHMSNVPKKNFVSLENVHQDLSSSLPGQQHSKETDLQQLPIEQSVHPHHFLSLHKTSSGTNISSTDLQTTVDSPRQESTSHQKTDSAHHTWQSQFVRRRSRSQNARSDYTQVRGDPDGCGLDSFSVFHHSACTEMISEGTPLKKGWLMRKGTKDWHKQWVVLTVCSLAFYQDPRAEILNMVDGKIDVLSIKSVGETKTENNYGFTIETLDGKRYTFSAVTAGMCNNWIQAIHHGTKVCTVSSHSGRIGRTRSQERVPTMRQDLQLSLNTPSKNDDYSTSENLVTEHFSAVCTHRSSPPLNRTVISKVKEKSRSRSSSHSRLSDKHGKLLTPSSDDHSSPVNVNDHHSKKVTKISTSRDSDFEYPYWRKLNPIKDYKNSISYLERTSDSTKIKATQVPVSQVGEAKYKNKHPLSKGLENGSNLIETNPDSCLQLKHTANVDTGHMSFEERSQIKHLKDEQKNGTLSQNICMLERNGKYFEEETGKSFPKGKLIVIEDLQTSLHLCRDRLFHLKQRLENTPEVKVEALLVGKDILMLCGEIEKILGLSDQKLGNGNEIYRLKNIITELQALCETKNSEVEKLTNNITTLKSSLNEQEQGFQKARTEVDFLQKEKMSLKDRVKQLEMVLRTSDSDHYHSDCCKALNEENTQLKLLLNSANETIKSHQQKLEKDCKSFGNLEVINSQLKQSINEFQSQHCSQIALVITKLNDLTLKLVAVEKSLGCVKKKLIEFELRQESQRSSIQENKGVNVSKELETKLIDLESKVNYIETSLNNKCEDDIHVKNIMANDSSTAVENQGSHLQNVFVRLSSLNSRVKTACEIIGTNQEVGRIREVSTKPEIWLRRGSEAEASQDDWSTFSVVDSLPDLFSGSTEDGIDSTPTSFSSCTEMLFQKVKMVAAWIKETLINLHKQHYLNEASLETSDYCTNDVRYLVKACQCLLPEDRQPDKNTEASLIYLLLVLQEIAIGVIKLNELKSLQKHVVMKELCMINKLVTLVESKINTSSIDKADSYSVVDSPLLSLLTSFLPTCTVSTCDTLSAPEDNYFQNKDIVEDDLRNKLCELEEHWNKVRKVMDTVKHNSIAILVRLLQNDELQRGNQESLQGDLISENIILEELLLGEIYHIILCQSKMSQKHIFSKFQEHCVTALYSESTALEIWNVITQEQMTEEMENLFAQIKNSCVKNLSFHGYHKNSESKLLSQQSMLCLVGLTDVCILIGLLQGATTYCAKRVKNITLKDGAESDNKKCIQLEDSAWPENLYSHLQQQAAKLLTVSCPLSLSKEKTPSFSHLDDPLPVIEKLSQFSARNIARVSERYIEKITKIKSRYQEEVHRIQTELEALKQTHSQWLHEGCPSCEVLRKEVNCLCFEVQRWRGRASQDTLCQTCKKLSSELEEAKQVHKEELKFLQGQLLTEKENLRKQLTATFDNQVKACQEESDRLQKELQLAQNNLKILKLENEEQMRILTRTHQQKVHVLSEQAVRQRYQEDLAEWKRFSEKSLNDIEKSYKGLVEELMNRHKQDVERLKTEKEQALEEEIQATKTALAVIKETYHKELQDEIRRCKRENMEQKQHPDNFETLYKEHRDTLDEIRKDMVSLTEKFSLKCLENATLKEHLEIVKHQKEEGSKLLDFLLRSKQSQAHSSLEVAEIEPLKEIKDLTSVDTSEPMGTLNILRQCHDLPLTAESGLQLYNSCSQNSTIPLHLYMKETSVESQAATSDHQLNSFSRTED